MFSNENGSETPEGKFDEQVLEDESKIACEEMASMWILTKGRSELSEKIQDFYASDLFKTGTEEVMENFANAGKALEEYAKKIADVIAPHHPEDLLNESIREVLTFALRRSMHSDIVESVQSKIEDYDGISKRMSPNTFALTVAVGNSINIIPNREKMLEDVIISAINSMTSRGLGGYGPEAEDESEDESEAEAESRAEESPDISETPRRPSLSERIAAFSGKSKS